MFMEHEYKVTPRPKYADEFMGIDFQEVWETRFVVILLI